MTTETSSPVCAMGELVVIDFFGREVRGEVIRVTFTARGAVEYVIETKRDGEVRVPARAVLRRLQVSLW